MAIIKKSMTIPNIQVPLNEFHYVDYTESAISIALGNIVLGGFIGIINPSGNQSVHIDTSSVNAIVVDCATGQVIEEYLLPQASGIIVGCDAHTGNGKMFIMPFSTGGEVPANQIPMRKKTELEWGNLTGISIPTTATNLLSWLQSLPSPIAGAWGEFTNLATGKINVYNDNRSVNFKLVVNGTWTGGAARSLQVDFTGVRNSRLVANRGDAVTSDSITLTTFFSINKDGPIALNGTMPMIKANGGTFSVTGVGLIIEQETTLESIAPIATLQPAMRQQAAQQSTLQQSTLQQSVLPQAPQQPAEGPSMDAPDRETQQPTEEAEHAPVRRYVQRSPTRKY